MVQKSLGNSGRFLNGEWHRKRWEATSETYKIEEWSEIEQTKYDLDSVKFDRKYKESTYFTDSRLDNEGASESGEDMRQFPVLE